MSESERREGESRMRKKRDSESRGETVGEEMERKRETVKGEKRDEGE